MYRVELYAQVRRSVIVEGLSEREAVKRFGLARETVRKMLRYRIPPGYRRNKPVRRPKLEAFTGIINLVPQTPDSHFDRHAPDPLRQDTIPQSNRLGLPR